MSSTVIIGKHGQVARALTHIAQGDVLTLSSQELDLSKPSEITETLDRFLGGNTPKVIINAAAYTAVDQAEEEESLALTINAESPAILAEYAFKKGAVFIHYSTDYVFNGEGDSAWKEEDVVGPLGAYGRTKLAGEEAIANVAERYLDAKWLIFRTSWVYDETGKNFVNTMLRLGAEREQLKIVSDQIGAPTYAGDIAYYTLEALKKTSEQTPFPSGIYHLCNAGETSWHGFAEAIFDQARVQGLSLQVKDVDPIPSTEFPTPAPRPKNSRLDLSKLSHTFNVNMPDWKDALKRCLEHKLEQKESA